MFSQVPEGFQDQLETYTKRKSGLVAAFRRVVTRSTRENDALTGFPVGGEDELVQPLAPVVQEERKETAKILQAPVRTLWLPASFFRDRLALGARQVGWACFGTRNVLHHVCGPTTAQICLISPLLSPHVVKASLIYPIHRHRRRQQPPVKLVVGPS